MGQPLIAASAKPRRCETVALANSGTTSALIPVPTQPISDTGNYQVGPYSYPYTNANYSDETNPAAVRYAIIDLGTGTPMRVTNSGYALLRVS
jgi:hypothetical protein